MSSKGGNRIKDIKQKPKLLEKAGYTKDIGAILKRKYKIQQIERRDFSQKQHCKPQKKQSKREQTESNNPVQYAVKQSEHGAEIGVSQGFSSASTMVDTAYHMGKNLVQRVKFKATITPSAHTEGVNNSANTTSRDAGIKPEPSENPQPRNRLQVERTRNRSLEKKSRYTAEYQGNVRRQATTRVSSPKTESASQATTSRQNAEYIRRTLPRLRTEKLRTSQTINEKATRTHYKPRLKTVEASDKVHKNITKTAYQKAQRQAVKRAAITARKAAKQAAKLTAKSIKLVIKAAVAFVRAIAALLGVSVPLVIAIVVIGIAAALLASPFGMFFSDQDTSPDTTRISQIVQETTAEFYARIESIKQGRDYVDSVEMHYIGCDGGIQLDNWIDTLAVFSVKTALDNNGIDVVTIDQTRIDLIRDVFSDMNTIDYYVEEIEHEAEDDEAWTEYILHITVTSKTADEQAQEYGFSVDQKSMLSELLKPEYNEYFVMLIAGTSAGITGGDIGIIADGIYIWPSAASKVLTSYFGGRINPVTGIPDNHTGIDIAAGYGTAILAAADGTVITSSFYDGGYGNCIVIDHGNGNRTLYGHMSRRNVSAGQAVTQGQIIGFVGSTGMSTGPHLHFETLVNGTRVDPLLYFSGY